ncbi:MAG: tRNA (guanosine(46)-N7)-methyltransferase TrmB [Rhodobacteraceae bacterium]|nr:tRNA (guanosine(46)-N7)-methyltransferase TrmB [Paracoccaceae bacterium]
MEPGNPSAIHRNFYGRRYGKRLRRGQRKLLEEALEAVSLGRIGAGQASAIDTTTLFGDVPVWLEVGFGSGEHLLRLAGQHPDTGFIGCEPFMNGVASLLGKLEAKPQPNLRIYPGDVRDVLDVLADESIGRVFLLYPDPWPKMRHHRRRFVTGQFLTPLAKVMQPGAELRLATDISDYARQAVEQISASPYFTWEPVSRRSWLFPWEGWQSTRYEKKALRDGRDPIYLTFIRG